MQVTTTLDEVKALAGADICRRLAKQLGGVRKFGRKTPLRIVEMASRVGVWDAMFLIRETAGIWEVNEARLLAADLAAEALPVYERFKPHCGAVKQAIEAAREFARGRVGKPVLAAAHRLVGPAAERSLIGHGIRTPEADVAAAAYWVSDPFGRSGEMIWHAWVFARRALERVESHPMMAGAIVEVLQANERISTLLHTRSGDWSDLVAEYHDAIRNTCLDVLDGAATHQALIERRFLAVLAAHLGGVEEGGQ